MLCPKEDSTHPRPVLLTLLIMFLVVGCSGMSLFGQGKLEESDDPEDGIDPRFRMAQEAHLAGELNKALAIYDKILSTRGDDVPTFITYGNILWKLGRLDEAVKMLMKAVSQNPKHIKARQFLGQLYYFRGQRALAREQFDAMHKLKFMRDDVLHSAKLNLARIDLLEEKWRSARKHFSYLKKEAGHADRKSADRGFRRLREMMAMDEWPRYNSGRLAIHFSPSLKKYAGREAKEELGKRLDAWIVRACKHLKIPLPDRWHLYIFQDDGECSMRTGRDTAHGWDYSWWFSYVADDSEFSIEHTLAVQLCARWGGSRPKSRSLVEGVANYLSEDGRDVDRWAVKLAKQGELPSILDLHIHQRRKAQYGAGISYTRYLINKVGLEKVGAMWRGLNVKVNLRRFKIGKTTRIDYAKAYEELYQETMGISFRQFANDWEAHVRNLAASK